ncbi:MAG: NAD kinase [Bacteroidota bacterium]|nr:NAD kinase [Bacteroidota bacterium]
MNVAIYGRRFDRNFDFSIKVFFSKLKNIANHISIYEPFKNFMTEHSGVKPTYDSLFSKFFTEENKPDLLFSIGGDGTFLDSATFINKLDIPIVGINSGRLGFLANISVDEVSWLMKAIENKSYHLEERLVLKADIKSKPFDYPYCVNEITIQKQNSGSMITTHVYIDDVYLNSYWADGLIISTPTGSTAYSLSVGGPIMSPEANSLIITPIAPHNLTVRPIIIPKGRAIRIEVENRGNTYMCSLDSRTEFVNTSNSIEISAADFQIKTLLLEGKNFYKTIRNKLMWGFDRRN